MLDDMDLDRYDKVKCSKIVGMLLKLMKWWRERWSRWYRNIRDIDRRRYKYLIDVGIWQRK